MTDVVFDPDSKQKTALQCQRSQPSHTFPMTSKGVSVWDELETQFELEIHVAQAQVAGVLQGELS